MCGEWTEILGLSMAWVIRVVWYDVEMVCALFFEVCSSEIYYAIIGFSRWRFELRLSVSGSSFLLPNACEFCVLGKFLIEEILHVVKNQ